MNHNDPNGQVPCRRVLKRADGLFRPLDLGLDLPGVVSEELAKGREFDAFRARGFKRRAGEWPANAESVAEILRPLKLRTSQ
ncbi:hypothetical protein JKG68_21795 [Microvirga aerilata]|uniref:Uncharacterized protein n=1 Tax=Microvirga aerilata TaxID=670292 RepID=A0A936Z8Z4_9HYPH|nr:hypothetical protein [Microvirga aerilata]MBL0406593.1 hypothetical protein [Microvirga aerilata]